MDEARRSVIADAAGGPFSAIGAGTPGSPAPIEIAGTDPVLPSPWPIGDVAAVALAGVGAGAARLAATAGGDPGSVRVSVADAAAATIGFALMRVDGAPMARTNAANPWVGRYRCGDGRWIHLHGGFPPLVEKLAAILGIAEDGDETTIAAATSGWDSGSLENVIAERHGCAAIIRSDDEWRTHPHGSVVHDRPVVVTIERDAGDGGRGGRRDDGDGAVTRRAWSPSPTRPLDGLRVLDLTRVLAGPTCGRTLAAVGADVLHVRGPSVPYVPAFVVDTGHGKRQAFADLTDPAERDRLRAIALDADVVVQGWRPGVVDRFGLDEGSLRDDGFTGTYGSVNCYGHDGPWSDRAGWEQLAQSTSGLCLDPLGDAKPTMLPSAATDYTTGFVLAAGVLEAIARSLADGQPRRVEASLCQTAAWILRVGRHVATEPSGVSPELQRTTTEFGVVDHLGPCVTVDGLDVGWRRPTSPLGSGELTW